MSQHWSSTMDMGHDSCLLYLSDSVSPTAFWGFLCFFRFTRKITFTIQPILSILISNGNVLLVLVSTSDRRLASIISRLTSRLL